ncbi:heterodimeric methylmalonyl-CoA mutase small subunit [Saccharopolyspora erythraea NRRL 2338]|uniref:Methylmalonyl-CoA mutase, beta subunit n=2 Tax=Saccharopolyspora erythraea TaxID=1836 RepID=A4FL99_SACEN|nr:methylmalonyl-CoA mutase family protein [Saccharopolyspora erythraea]EQD85225.1 methylmalonyl-CoA mutase [Saccharopolyspora erythraea D]PFG98464.1 heterodimeric methylmalonyl-CoA mutase small subunit [Saccharopolyspora erythraea NRRL 2338]QRK88527.1 methylmalonyl-CoA mutase small subunit [Saccharopolyspora erythraea]CAM04824.1 methylmalonyl-CoA mutase, beta subunit [Saccharopolyspora erythraea NRRL 2338]
MVAHSTTSDGPELPLAAEFPEPARQQWRQQVEKVLRRSGLLPEGRPAPEPVEDVLASATYDGITVHPLYTEGPASSGVPGLAPYVRGSRAQGCVSEGWDVRQHHAHPDASETNREILADLYNGTTSLWLELGPTGLPVDSLADALEGVHLDMIGVVLDAGDEAARAASALLELAREQGVRPSALRANLGADPLSTWARTGQERDLGLAAEVAAHCASHPGLRAITVDGLPYHEAGGSDAEELGCSIAAGVTYLRVLAGELGAEAASGLLEFRYAATADQFLTIAKLRAARRLWERVTREIGVAERAQLQHAVTSSAMLTRRDPWVNMLRTTIATFAAGVGGARSVTVRPFDAAIGLPDPFSRRIARNTQSLLLEESHLAQVIDPAGGSWYVETLTDELAHKAWEWFRRIEAEGGLPAALRSGLVADRLAETWQRRRDAVAHRTDPITGVTEFPNLEEPALRRDPAPEPLSGGLPRHRYAEDFERLRDASDAHLAETGARPKVFLATLGSLAEHNARASFARNLFGAGGLETPDAGPTESTEDVVKAFAGSGTPVACLCSGDRIYGEHAEETARALREAGADQVLLAGSLEVPGVDGRVFGGCNALEVLQDVHRRLGVQQ